MRILWIGGTGYLSRHLSDDATRHELVSTYRSTPLPGLRHSIPLDVTEVDAFPRVFDLIQPDAVIYAAALNPGAGTEDEMFAVNATGAGEAARQAHERGIRFVYVSTDHVHAGTHAPYADDAAPTPINVYGRTKAAGEAHVLDADPGACCVRTSLIYSLEHIDRGTGAFARRLNAGETLYLFDDAIRQPVEADQFIAALFELAGHDYAGSINVAGSTSLNRTRFAQLMLTFWGVPYNDQTLTSGPASAVTTGTPLDLRLDLTAAKRILSQPPSGVERVLAAHAVSKFGTL
ncbi:MAG: sugar nucleotide-binding protein [Bacteroidota bacterium]